jgi:AraC-like DNA-binding protein
VADAEGDAVTTTAWQKLIDVARAIGYESDAAVSKALKRVVGASPGEYLKRGFEDLGNAGTTEEF